jgi:hypothetical protein
MPRAFGICPSFKEQFRSAPCQTLIALRFAFASLECRRPTPTVTHHQGCGRGLFSAPRSVAFLPRSSGEPAWSVLPSESSGNDSRARTGASTGALLAAAPAERWCRVCPACAPSHPAGARCRSRSCSVAPTAPPAPCRTATSKKTNRCALTAVSSRLAVLPNPLVTLGGMEYKLATVSPTESLAK